MASSSRAPCHSAQSRGVLRIGASVLVDTRDSPRLAQPGLVGAAKRLPPREIEGSTGVPVIGRSPSNDHSPLGPVFSQVIGAGHLQRGFHGLRPARHREHPCPIEGDDGCQFRGIGLQGLGGECRAMDICEGRGLRRDRLRDLLDSMADADNDGAPGGVQVLLSLGVGHPRPACGDGGGQVILGPGEHRAQLVAARIIESETIGLRLALSSKGGVLRARLRDLSAGIGRLPAGLSNAITDVPGVLVGHATVVRDEPHVIRSGITMVVPRDGGIWTDYAYAASHIFNGNGEMTGLAWVEESGMLGSPIAITNTYQVGMVRDFLAKESVRVGVIEDFLLPVVGETDDGWLSDAAAFALTEEDAASALSSASGGDVSEGCVGGGTGMICHEFKGGIGTSSRVVDIDGRYPRRWCPGSGQLRRS